PSPTGRGSRPGSAAPLPAEGARWPRATAPGWRGRRGKAAIHGPLPSLAAAQPDSACKASMIAVILLIAVNFLLIMYAPVMQLVSFILLVAFMTRRRAGSSCGRSSADEGEVMVGFFHPNCNAGGGGERVLWLAVRALQIEHGNKVQLFVYTGDLDAYKDSPEFDPAAEGEMSQADKERLAGKAILAKVERTLGVGMPDPDSIRFAFLSGRDRIKPGRYPRLTLLRQSIGGAVLGLEAIGLANPDVMIDTMGCHFAGAVFRYFGGCKTACYVHYPLISTDMIEVVNANSVAVNNPTTNSPFKRLAKLVYYRLFALLYGWFGRRWNLVMTNSSWTTGHIASLWGCQLPRLLYPPVYVKEFAHLGPDSLAGRLPIVLSVAQFRPEKDHPLQLRAFAKFLQLAPKEVADKASLVLIGGCRNDEDSARVDRLRCLAEELSIEDRVRFQRRPALACIPMRDEHFGIGIVDMMAAGLTVIAHNSGGPKMDIVTDPQLGFLAATEDEYAQALVDAFSLDDKQLRRRFEAVRRHIEKFAEEKNFMPGFCQLTKPLIDYRGGEHVPTANRSKAEFLKLNMRSKPLAWLHFCLPPLLILLLAQRTGAQDLPLISEANSGADLTAALGASVNLTCVALRNASVSEQTFGHYQCQASLGSASKQVHDIYLRINGSLGARTEQEAPSISSLTEFEFPRFPPRLLHRQGPRSPMPRLLRALEADSRQQHPVDPQRWPLLRPPGSANALPADVPGGLERISALSTALLTNPVCFNGTVMEDIFVCHAEGLAAATFSERAGPPLDVSASLDKEKRQISVKWAEPHQEPAAGQGLFCALKADSDAYFSSVSPAWLCLRIGP
uniref:GDP-Man:Man(3)GlcNAc(2)-PP-Dol alpha-1,2-mannosyltransferase n=1 Tax=Macrostomum lignano TaxID=282301 RepID=A0A1I8FQ24_9PLAT